MSATTLPTKFGREVVRCECGLIQFKSASGHCVKSFCRKPYNVDLPVNPSKTTRQGPATDTISTLSIAQYHPKKVGLSHVGEMVPVLFRVLRKARGMSQRIFALKMGVPRTYVNRIETGRILPGLGVTERMCGALGISVRDFIYLCEQAS